jgi:hypothetical protein
VLDQIVYRKTDSFLFVSLVEIIASMLDVIYDQKGSCIAPDSATIKMSKDCVRCPDPNIIKSQEINRGNLRLCLTAMSLIGLMIKGASLIFIAAMSIYQNIPTKGIFRILWIRLDQHSCRIVVFFLLLRNRPRDVLY